MAKILGKHVGDIPGTLKDYAGTSTPYRTLLCDGASLLVASYPALFAQIGYTHGGAGANFNVPDSRRRTYVGKGGSGTGTLGNAVGNIGGAETHALSIAELAAHLHTIGGTTGGQSTPHTHSGTTNGAGSHNHGIFVAVNGTDNGVYYGFDSDGSTNDSPVFVSGYTDTTSDHSHGFTTGNNNVDHTHTLPANTGSNGSGTAHNNLQPSLVVTKVIVY